MSLVLSDRIQRILPSATLSINATTKKLIAAGKNIINLSIGEPDFATPAHIADAAIKAIQAGNNKYTAVSGTAELKQAIITKLKRDNHLSYQSSQILATTGGKQAIFNTMLALINPGDEVIIPAPYWVSYPDMTLICDGKPVFIAADISQNYKITAQQLEQAITKKTKLFILNSPSNPTGMAYTQAELKALAEVLLRHPQIYILSDDMYEHILWSDEKFQNIINVCPELYERTIVINAVSKSYAMTGWRLGFAAARADLIAEMEKAQGQSTSNPCSIAQIAATEAFAGDQSCIALFKKTFKEKHDFVYQQLATMPGFRVSPADGAFYMFPDVNEACKKLGLKDDLEFTDYLLNQAEVAVVPGTAFGMPGSIRLSYATNMKLLEQALRQIRAAL